MPRVLIGRTSTCELCMDCSARSMASSAAMLCHMLLIMCRIALFTSSRPTSPLRSPSQRWHTTLRAHGSLLSRS